MTAVEEEVSISHKFEALSSMEDGECQYSPITEIAGISWKLGVKRNADVLVFHVYYKQAKERSMVVSESNCLQVNGEIHSENHATSYQITGSDWTVLSKWDLVMEDLTDDTVEWEFYVEKSTEIPRKQLMDFGESTKEFSDAVLVVEDQKFYVSKLFLARNSSYFKTLLLGSFGESGKPEVTLHDISPFDFQNFLELLYGQSPIDDSTIGGIIHLADMYDAKLAIQKCEHYLIDDSERSLKEKLQLAHRYNLKNLKESCLSKVTTVDHIRSVMADDLNDMEHSAMDFHDIM